VAALRRHATFALFFTAAGLLGPTAAAQPAAPEPTLEQVVSRLAAYVDAYGAQASVIVGVEKYTQQITVNERDARPRSLVSDFAIVKVGDRAGWTGYRDVIEVNGQSVTDRQDRLLGLLTGPRGGEDELRRVADESARYNVGPVIRNFNVPTSALFFFQPSLVARFTFRRTGEKTIDGVRAWVLDFKETHTPTLIVKRDGSNVPCEGTVWVVPGDGAVLRTRLRLRKFADSSHMEEYRYSRQGATDTKGTVSGAASFNTSEISQSPSSVDIEVSYRREPATGLLLPGSMTEIYEGQISSGTRVPVVGRMTGRASYSNYRRFDTAVRIVLPK
jgi:hypothetical protein